MAKMIVIDTKKQIVRLEHSAPRKRVAHLLGAGPIVVHVLPNGDRLKVSRDSDEQTSFTIGHSAAFRGSGVVITKGSVNVSNMSLLLSAICQLVNFHGNADNAREGAIVPAEQMDFWPLTDL